MNICITGCLGFIGTHVTRLCLNEGWKVCGIDKITYAANIFSLIEFNRNPNFFFIKRDINDITSFNGFDYVINLAAETHVCNSITNSSHFMTSNVNGVHNMLEVIRKTSRFPVFLQFSTDEVYGSRCHGSSLEGDLVCPSSPYSASKAAADMLILAWAKTYELPYVILRPTNNYGLNQHWEKLIPTICRNISLKLKTQLHNGGTPIRNWLHVEDTVNAVIFLIQNKIKNQIYNISSNVSLSNYDMFHQIFKIINNNTPINEWIGFDDVRLGQDMRYSVNSEKLQQLGWKPKKKFKAELPKVVAFYCNKANRSNKLIDNEIREMVR